MNKRPIGVFDSGIGGLSILRELQAQLPAENFIFLADQAHVPYGEKTKKELVSLASRITRFMLKQNAKLIVVACNTATCYAIDDLRKRFDINFIGTVPAVKPALKLSRTKTIAVISTPATAKSPSLKKIIKTYAKNKTVIAMGCKGLEDKIEEGNLITNDILFLLNKYLSPIAKSKADYLVLGCTHYPFIKTALSSVLKRKIQFLDSGNAIAKHTQTVLKNSKTKNTQKKKGYTKYFTTTDAKKFSRIASKLLKKQVSALHAQI
jgi:glutamate racemase